VAAAFAYLQFMQQKQVSQELLVSNQVSKGFEQLGSKTLEIRLGGIYALEGVMKISEQYRQPVLDAFCAFVREHTKDGTKIGPKPSTDIQAVLTVIGRRNFVGEADLTNSHLRGADLINANLRDANLSKADLSDADETGAVLNNATLRGITISQDRLSAACGSGTRELPPNLSLNACPPSNWWPWLFDW
jgi:hypothetical protein